MIKDINIHINEYLRNKSYYDKLLMNKREIKELYPFKIFSLDCNESDTILITLDNSIIIEIKYRNTEMLADDVYELEQLNITIKIQKSDYLRFFASKMDEYKQYHFASRIFEVILKTAFDIDKSQQIELNHVAFKIDLFLR